MLHVHNLTRTFRSKKHAPVHALKQITIDFHPGETTVILGPSGSGKSTLLRCLNLLELPDSGTLAIADPTAGAQPVSVDFSQRISRATQRAVRSYSAMVFQDFQLFPHLKAIDNVTLGPTAVRGIDNAEAEQLGRELLTTVGLADRAESYPYQLSGGQQQRVAIARALAMSPSYLLCDEPTSALDPELATGVRKVLNNIAHGDTSLIMVTHDMTFARETADRIIFLVDGRIEFDGDPDQFFAAPTQRIAAFLAVFD